MSAERELTIQNLKRTYHAWLVGVVTYLLSAPITSVWVAGRMQEMISSTLEVIPSMKAVIIITAVPMALVAIILMICTVNAGEAATKYTA